MANNMPFIGAGTITGHFSSSKPNIVNIPQRRKGLGRLPGGSVLRKKRMLKKRKQFKTAVLSFSYGKVLNKIIYHYRVQRYLDDLIRMNQRWVDREFLKKAMVPTPATAFFTPLDFSETERKIANQMASCHFNTRLFQKDLSYFGLRMAKPCNVKTTVRKETQP
jgi:hypothetical protein